MWVNLKRKVFSLVDVCTVEGTPLFYVWLNLKVTMFNSILIILLFLTSQQKHTHRERKKNKDCAINARDCSQHKLQLCRLFYQGRPKRIL